MARPLPTRRAGRWRAQWVWAAAPTGPDGQPRGGRTYVAFRRDLPLQAVPDALPARVCADSRYQLWVNGREVGEGPVRINPRRRRFDSFDLAPFLIAGDNALAALVCFYGQPTAWWQPAPTLTSRVNSGGFLLEADGCATGGGWWARRLEGWTSLPGQGGVSGRGRDEYDLRSLAAGWRTEPAGDGDGWAPAAVLTGMSLGESGRPEPPNFPHGPYGSHPLPDRGPREHPLENHGGDVFGSAGVTSGTVTLDASGPAGARLTARMSEFADRDGRPTGDESVMETTFVLDGTRRRMTTFDTYGLRALDVRADAPVDVHGVTVTERLFPVVGGATFECSDPMLEQIWRVGRRTVSLCSTDAYLDCPTREQRAWTGDSVVHQMVDLTTNADWSLARWNVEVLASPRADGMLPMAAAGDAENADIAVIPDWALHWIHAVHNLYRYAGDREEIRRLLPVAEGVLRWFDPWVDDHGLLRDVPSWVIIDWASVYTEGVCGPLNGLWGRALLEFAEMAAWLGDGGRADWATATHARLRDGFELLWDDTRRRYVDSWIEGTDGEQRAMASQHGQAAAIVGRLAPQARWPELVTWMTAPERRVHAMFGLPDGPPDPDHPVAPGGPYMREGGHPPPWWDVDRFVVRAQPFFRYVVHDAVCAAGRPDLIAGMCREWAELLRFCDTSWSETWFGGTVSHGWSSTPTRDLMQRVLGVQPAEPGFGHVAINPALGDLDWARGKVPHPEGLIHVDVTPGQLIVDCPVPFTARGATFAPGRHTIT